MRHGTRNGREGRLSPARGACIEAEDTVVGPRPLARHGHLTAVDQLHHLERVEATRYLAVTERRSHTLLVAKGGRSR